MTTIINENFESMLDLIKESLKSTSFIAIDTEFTGLVADESLTPSLFDGAEQRYAKQRRSAASFVITQIGLSFFNKDIENNIFDSKTYSFYLCRRSVGSKLSSFLIDCSSIEFLADNDFDFNKWARHGIQYLNEIEEQDLRENFHNYLVFDKPLLNESIYEISKWLEKSKIDKKHKELTLSYKESINPLVNYAFIVTLRNRFETVWIEKISNKYIAKIVDKNERKKLESFVYQEEEDVIRRMTGFSIVFKWIVDAKRPIVGHNMIMDLLMLHQQFYRPLPEKLKDFKASIHRLFPYVFDTKSILFNERKNLTEMKHVVEMRSLGDIYKCFLEDEYKAKYRSAPKFEQYEDNFHEAIINFSPHDAGFDSYATGFVFIHIGYILKVKDKRICNNSFIPNWFEFLTIMEAHCNKVNLIRCNLHYLNLSSSDPPSIRPQWLLVENKTKNSKVFLSKLRSTLSSHGFFDIKSIGANQALIAVNTYGVARSILNTYKNDNEFKVTTYNIFKHSRVVRLILWSTFGVSSYLTLLLTGKLIATFMH